MKENVLLCNTHLSELSNLHLIHEYAKNLDFKRIASPIPILDEEGVRTLLKSGMCNVLDRQDRTFLFNQKTTCPAELILFSDMFVYAKVIPAKTAIVSPLKVMTFSPAEVFSNRLCFSFAFCSIATPV